jgi:hypothetical protein
MDTTSMTIEVSNSQRPQHDGLLVMMAVDHEDDSNKNTHHQQQQNQHHYPSNVSSSPMMSSSSPSSFTLLSDERKPLKKRLRNYHEISTRTTSTTASVRLPGTLLEKDHQPLKPRYYKLNKNISSYSCNDDGDDSMATRSSSAFEELMVVTPVPPPLVRQTAGIYPVTDAHYYFLHRHASQIIHHSNNRGRVMGIGETFNHSPGSYFGNGDNDNHSFGSPDYTPRALLFYDDTDDCEEGQSNPTSDGLSSSADTNVHHHGSPQPPQLKESESLRIMMEELLRPAAAFQQRDCSSVFHDGHGQPTSFHQHAASYASTYQSTTVFMEARTPPRGYGDLHKYSEDTTKAPAKLKNSYHPFRWRFHHFSSFASHSSAGSSCVTPSPCASPMTIDDKEDEDDNNNDDDDMNDDRRGNGDEEASGRSILALKELARRKSLTDQQKVERAQEFLVWPPDIRPPPFSPSISPPFSAATAAVVPPQRKMSIVGRANVSAITSRRPPNRKTQVGVAHFGRRRPFGPKKETSISSLISDHMALRETSSDSDRSAVDIHHPSQHVPQNNTIQSYQFLASSSDSSNAVYTNAERQSGIYEFMSRSPGGAQRLLSERPLAP